MYTFESKELFCTLRISSLHYTTLRLACQALHVRARPTPSNAPSQLSTRTRGAWLTHVTRLHGHRHRNRACDLT